MMLGSVPATAADTATASIQGTVTAPAGVDVAGTYVFAWSAAFQSQMGRSSVGADGDYKIIGLPAGSYKLSFAGQDTGAQDQWYKNAASYDTAAAVTVAEGQALTGINSTLAKGATVSGKVTIPAGVSSSNLSVSANSAGSRQQAGRSDVLVDGTYKITGLPAGSYKLNFSGWNTGLQNQWYKNASSFDTAIAVSVNAGQDLTGINATLVKGATISGKVTVPAGLDPAKIMVIASPTAAQGQEGNSFVAEDGSYKVIGLTAGSYKLHFSGWSTGVPDQWYKNAYSSDTATAVTVTASQDLTGVNVTLVKGATIGGKVTVPGGSPIGIYVNATATAIHGQSGQSTAEPDGSYKITGLPAGSYKVSFSDMSGRTIRQWYKNASSIDTATAVTVAAGQDLAGINATLVKGATISGKITAPAGVVLTKVVFPGVTIASTTVKVYGVGSSTAQVAQGYVNPDGTYQVTGLAAGSYKVFISGWNTGAADQWYDKAGSFAAARTLTVAAGQDLTGINPALVKGSTISGKIAGGGTAGTPVSVLDTAGAVVKDGYSNADGTYSVGGLAAGSYKVAFNRASGSSLAEAQFYNNKPESAGASVAQTVTVGASASVPNVNATLVTGGSIAGVLTDESAKPLSNTRVYAYTRDGSLITRTGITGADGKFTVAGLSTGKYVVVAQSRADGSKIYSGNVLAEASAKTVTVTVGKSTNMGALSFGSSPLALTAAPVPTVTGTTVSGQKLTAVPGIWGPAPVTLAYQWKRAGVNISGATGSTYVLTSGDVGKTITVTVTGSKPGYTTAAKTSAATKAVTAPVALAAAPVPTVTGRTVTGQKLTAVPGVWGPAPVTLAYQWKRAGVNISGATGSTYVLTSGDVGKTITVTVTGSKTGYTTTARTSAATKSVTAN
ncbi:hypothetical protein AB4089_22275 [Arthrobacter sp. 2MCAF15]|uniref:hypothetical protein n=1 Tax=Arthrobacter sp. 2MCAF15 TaxID=3232984 RepID=UPI003F90F0D8